MFVNPVLALWLDWGIATKTSKPVLIVYLTTERRKTKMAKEK
jgi:hypothetical protein